MQKLTDIAFWSLPSYEELTWLATQHNLKAVMTGEELWTLGTRVEVARSYVLLKILVALVLTQPLAMINRGIYAANNIFTIVREEQIPINYMINGYFTNQPISTFVTAKSEGKKTIFDKVNYLNRYNYILIDKQAISWTLTLSHLARKTLAPKIQ